MLGQNEKRPISPTGTSTSAEFGQVRSKLVGFACSIQGFCVCIRKIKVQISIYSTVQFIQAILKIKEYLNLIS